MTDAKTGWTPGPWRAEDAHDGYEIVSSSREMSATVAVLAARRSITGAADAHLIAAAPELADRSATLVDRDCVINGNKIIIEFADHGEAFTALFEMRQALAKARGEQS